MIILKGIPVNQGIVEGKTFIKLTPTHFLHQKSFDQVNIESETQNYLEVLSILLNEFKQIRFEHKELSNQTQTQLAELYIAILEDPSFKTKVVELITSQKIPASTAILEQLKLIKHEFAQLNNEYFRSRYADFESVGHQLIARITGTYGYKDITDDVILVTDTLSAVDLLNIPLEHIKGIITSKGGITSHASIFAESLGIPSIFGVSDIFDHIKNGDEVIIDGYIGEVIITPNDENSMFYKKVSQHHLEYQKNVLNSFKDKHSTLDDREFHLYSNISSIKDLETSMTNFADGIGLFRSETPVLFENKLPSLEEQISFYKIIFSMSNNQIFTIRTFDLGGDKTILDNQITPLDEDNPFLGYRSTRHFVQDPRLFKEQITAIISNYQINKNIRILIPFITNLEEFLFLKQIILDLYQEMYQADCPIPIGVMAEVPSVFICIEDFLPHVDFVSIGSNDLTQYILATDRNNIYVSHYHKSFHPAIIKLLHQISQACHQHGVPFSLCGEMAKDPHMIRLICGLGIDTISVAPINIPITRYILAKSEASECHTLAQKVLTMTSHQEIEQLLHNDLKQFFQNQEEYSDFWIIANEDN